MAPHKDRVEMSQGKNQSKQKDIPVVCAKDMFDMGLLRGKSQGSGNKLSDSDFLTVPFWLW